MLNLFEDDKKKKDESTKKDTTTNGIKVLTVIGTEIGDVKTVKVYPNGTVTITNGGY